MTAPRETYTVTLQPAAGIDGPRALRQALKLLLRHCGLRCIRVSEQAGQDGSTPRQEPERAPDPRLSGPA